MFLVDVNVLVYAHRVDMEHHEFYRGWLEDEIRASHSFGLSSPVATGFIRVVTNQRFPNRPTPLPQALATIETLASQPHCFWVHPEREHWRLFAELCRRYNASGKLVADALHAAIAIEHGATWVTRDRNYERFTPSGLRLRMLEPA